MMAPSGAAEMNIVAARFENPTLPALHEFKAQLNFRNDTLNFDRFGGDLAGGYYMQPTIFEGTNDMRIFQEEIFGPVVSVTSFDGYDDAIAIANDTLYGLGSGVWTRDGTRAYRAGRDIQAGRVWTNSYHAYPAHAAFGGYKQSGIGRENHKMMLDHYQQTKNLLVSYSPKAQGFF